MISGAASRRRRSPRPHEHDASLWRGLQAVSRRRIDAPTWRPHAHSGIAPHARVRPRAQRALPAWSRSSPGWWTNSLALLSDAGHMLGDVGAIALSLAAATLAARPAVARQDLRLVAERDPRRAGERRDARRRRRARRGRGRAPPRRAAATCPAAIVAWVAAFGLAVNLVSVVALARRARAATSTCAARSCTRSPTRSARSARSSPASLVATRGWTLADPLASLFIAVLVSIAGVRPAARHGARAHGRRARVDPGRPAARRLRAPTGVRAVHDLHVWSLTSRFPAVSAHVVADPALSLAEGQILLDRLRRCCSRSSRSARHPPARDPGGRGLRSLRRAQRPGAPRSSGAGPEPARARTLGPAGPPGGRSLPDNGVEPSGLPRTTNFVNIDIRSPRALCAHFHKHNCLRCAILSVCAGPGVAVAILDCQHRLCAAPRPRSADDTAGACQPRINPNHRSNRRK